MSAACITHVHAAASSAHFRSDAYLQLGDKSDLPSRIGDWHRHRTLLQKKMFGEASNMTSETRCHFIRSKRLR
jgi:hypothetical protein